MSLSPSSNAEAPEVAIGSKDISASEQPRHPAAASIGNIEDFKYAPSKPEGDPWENLLKPLMDKEKRRCDGWKDEVQNLLIFAGLFSAVVTAFIVESYKTLQPDPNDAIISLLAQVATRFDGAFNSTSAGTPFMAQSFTPTASSVRVNVFWFISLVLSLTTVLVGIIGLQWLREHQSYSVDLTPKQKFALYTMRADGLETWHVDTIFASLPLLLQSALVLFLEGIVDFLHAIGTWSVVIPVILTIGATLLFLVATTILPWFQGIMLHFVSFPKDGSFHPKHSPSLCPYKSPQSRAVRELWRTLRRIPIRKVLYPIKFQYGFGKYFPSFVASWLRSMDHEDDGSSAFKFYVSCAWWFSPTWETYDNQWLAIRDGYARCFLRRASPSDRLRDLSHPPPFFDLVQGLIAAKEHKSLIPSAYYCFSELSELAMLPVFPTDDYSTLADFCQQSAFLHDLLGSTEMLLPHYLLPGSTPAAILSSNLKALSGPLHQHNMEVFLPTSASGRWNLRINLLRCFFQTRNVAVTELNFPQNVHCLSLHPVEINGWPKNWRNDKGYLVFFEQAADLTMMLLEQAGNGFDSSYAIHNPFVQRAILPNFLASSGYCATVVSDCEPLITAKEKYHAIFDFIGERLAREMETWTIAPTLPSLFFYMSSVLAYTAVYNVMPLDLNTTVGNSAAEEYLSFRAMCSTIHAYRQLTIDKGMIDSNIQSNMAHSCCTVATLFTSEWWEHLVEYSLPDLLVSTQPIWAENGLHPHWVSHQ